jgi:hypothetical protein
MGDKSTSPDRENERAGRASPGPVGLDPVSPADVGEIIDTDSDTQDYGMRPQPDATDMNRRDQFSRATWVMIVIAGVFLGIAMAMIAAG